MTIDIDRIKLCVANAFDLRVEQLNGKERRWEVTTARQLAIALCHQMTGCNYSELGRAFCQSHTSARGSVRKAQGLSYR
jgi:chromosomal replication initiation ATPase DnaA